MFRDQRPDERPEQGATSRAERCSYHCSAQVAGGVVDGAVAVREVEERPREGEPASDSAYPRSSTRPRLPHRSALGEGAEVRETRGRRLDREGQSEERDAYEHSGRYWTRTSDLRYVRPAL